MLIFYKKGNNLFIIINHFYKSNLIENFIVNNLKIFETNSSQFQFPSVEFYFKI